MSTKLALACLFLLACDKPEAPFSAQCELVTNGPGADGAVALKTEVIAKGLEVPWSLAFIPDTNDVLVTERPGRVRLVRDGVLQAQPVVTITVASTDEAGLLGLELSPTFSIDRLFFVYYSLDKPSGRVNRIERYRLANDNTSAAADRVILDDIHAGMYHDGGRLRFGPDGMLYVGTGDGRIPESAPDLTNPSGKILRITADGDIPVDNPHPGSPAFISGVRNVQGFDWIDSARLIVTDHGPTGDLARAGHDEVNIARAGDSLGWPDTWGCEERAGAVSPVMVFENAVPPGGAVIYRGTAIPEWENALLIGALAARHLHVLHFDAGYTSVTSHEVYLRGDQAFGRLRDVVVAPDGSVWMTTSNCDARGTCGADKDKIIRVTKG